MSGISIHFVYPEDIRTDSPLRFSCANGFVDIITRLVRCQNKPSKGSPELMLSYLSILVARINVRRMLASPGDVMRFMV